MFLTRKLYHNGIQNKDTIVYPYITSKTGSNFQRGHMSSVSGINDKELPPFVHISPDIAKVKERVEHAC